jgi:two-component system sensor histidine kinase KdpD
VSRDGEEVHLTPKEFAVLAELAKHPGRVLTHAHLLRTAWGPAQESQIDYLRVAVRALRQKLERNPSEPHLIVNEPAVGYRLNLKTT